MACSRGMEPIVRTLEGLVKGRVLQSKSPKGGKYFSFQGIPYAQPPVGARRFKPPERLEPWTGIRDALKEGPICPSFDMVKREYADNCDEDCLFLNVYTSTLPGGGNSKALPVMVWIHGGGFFYGSGNTDFYGPDHLVVRDIVLVTINYRLGALGFLTLLNEACPGNNGLRDQVEALRWVQRNISVFGGDPNNVTIFGESAGGAAVQYLMLSPQSKGLFHRAITQSGSVLCPWARTYDPVLHAFKLGEALGMTTTDKDKLLAFLRTVPARTIVTLSMKILREIQPDWYYLGNAFNPVTEPPYSDAFLSEPTEQLIKQGRLHDLPYILGVNTLEGLIMAQKGFPPLTTNEELARLLPPHPSLKKGSPLANSILEQIKSRYFPQGWDELKAADVLSAIYFLVGNEEVLKGLAAAKDRKSKTFFYVFTNESFKLFGTFLGFGDWKGTIHGDEIPCLLYSHFLDFPVETNSKEAKAIEIMCKLWGDFAATGDPTPQSKVWESYNNDEKPYLEIGEELTPKRNANEEEMKFWAGIYNQIENSLSHKL